jgi:hypothetical protein
MLRFLSGANIYGMIFVPVHHLQIFKRDEYKPVSKLKKPFDKMKRLGESRRIW